MCVGPKEVMDGLVEMVGEQGDCRPLASHFSDMAVTTCRNLACRCAEATPAPRLPHSSLRWNSVRNKSISKSSVLASDSTISALRRYMVWWSVMRRAICRCSNNFWMPWSLADSQHSGDGSTASSSPSACSRSCSSTNGSRCGMVVLGACGFVHSFMLFSIGLNFASKLNALSVCRCRRTCHVDDNLCT